MPERVPCCLSSVREPRPLHLVERQPKYRELRCSLLLMFGHLLEDMP